MVKSENPPAFPHPTAAKLTPASKEDYEKYGVSEYSEYIYGMTLRDYFAAAALPGLITIKIGINQDFPASGSEEREELAEIAWHIADAMLKARQGE